MVERLAQNLSVDDDDRVRAKNAALWIEHSNGFRLLTRNTLHVIKRPLAGNRIFIDMRRMSLKWNSGST